MKLGPPPKILQVTAMSRTTLQFPYRLDEKRPASVSLGRFESYELDIYDVFEIDRSINHLIAQGILLVKQIGFAYPSSWISYDLGGGQLIDVQSEITAILAAIGGVTNYRPLGKVVVKGDDYSLAFDEVFAVATAPLTFTLPSISDVLVIQGTATYTTPFNIKSRVAEGVVQVQAFGDDLIDGSASITLRFNQNGVTLTPTPVGWAIF